MNELAVFQFEEREVRTLEREGETWFVAKDVCDILGLENSRDVLAKMLDDDEAGVENFYVRSENGVMQNRAMNIINESGLYNLIFRSNKPEAKAFRKWVTSEVLPAIRKKGFYAVPGLMERLEILLERQSKLLDDPLGSAYRELEDYVKQTIEIEDRAGLRVYLRELWRDYTKKVQNPLNKHIFMYKIALDHPEFKLKYGRSGWYFDGCRPLRTLSL